MDERNSTMISPLSSGSPYFSVVIPSRNRPDLARTAIASILQQTFSDLEIVLLENSDPDHIFQDRFGDARLRIVPSPSVLGMPANWERLFDNVRGRYVILMSDKDQLASRGLEIIYHQTRFQEPALVTFGKLLVTNQGLVMHRPREATRPEILPAEPWLVKWFHDLAYDPDAPMLYNSAVHRELLGKVRPTDTPFFVGASPDIASSIVLLAAAKSYLNLGLPLVVGYYGPWSMGAHALIGRKHPRVQEFFVDLKDDPFERLGIVPSMPGGVAETSYACKQAYRHLLRDWNINWEMYPLLVAREVVLWREEARKADVSEEWDVLRRGAGGLYSHRAFARARMFRLRRRFANGLRKLAPPESRRGRLFRMALNRAGARTFTQQPEPLLLSAALEEIERKASQFVVS
jgi:glycosyltransferase involved in cell wall biosynthesis